jgi:PAS domain S-box-containing protein
VEKIMHFLFTSSDLPHSCNEQEARELLKHSAERFRTLVDNIPGAVYCCTYNEQLQGLPARTMVFLSEAIQTISGYPPSDFINNRVRSFTSIIHPQDRAKVEQTICESIDAKQPYVIEYRIVQTDGSIVWVYDKGQGISDENGEILWLDGVILDITERKQTTADLRDTQAFLNSIVDNLPLAVFIKEANDLQIVYWNKASEELFGYSSEEVLGKNDYDFFPEQQARALRAQDRQILTAGELMTLSEVPITTPHQGQRFVSTKKVPLVDETGTPRYLLGICEDITERKLAVGAAARSAEAPREPEADYRRIVETATEGVWMFDADSKTTFVNSRMAQMLGYTVEEMLGRSLFDFMDEASQVLAHTYIERRRQGIQERHDFKFRRKDGSDLWAIVSAAPIFDASGQFVGVLRMITDISDRKRTEEALRESHQQIADILERITEAFFALDHQWHFTYINGEASRILQQNPEALIGANFWDVFPEAVGSLVEQQYRQAMQEQVPVIFETFSEPLSRWIEVRAYPSGSGLSVFWRDITEQKQAQEALRKSEEQYRTLASHFPNGAVLAFDRELRYTLIEGEALAALDLSKEIAEGKTLWEVRSPEVCALLEPRYRAALSGVAEVFEMQYANRTYLVHTLPLKNAWGEVFAGMVMKQDITERKQAEEALRESERRFRAIFDSMFQFIGLMKPDGTLLEANQTALEFGGFQMVDIAGRPFWETPWWRISRQTQETLRAAIAKAAAGEFIRYEVDVVGAGDRVVTIDFSIKPVKDESGEVVLLIPEGRDISDKKLAEKALRESEQRFRATFDQAAVGIAHVDLEGKFLRINQKFCDLVGYTQEEMLARTLEDITHPDDLETDVEFVQQVLSGEIQTYSLEKRYIARNGEIIWINLTVSLRRRSSGAAKYFISVTQDISDRKLAEEALRQSESQLKAKNQQLEQTLQKLRQTQAQLIQNEKMVSLGQLVAGIAHEINNPISFIYGNVSYAHQYAAGLLNLVQLYAKHYPEPISEIQNEIEALDLEFLKRDFPKVLQSMKEGANRIREIVRSLRNFSRLDEAELKRVDVHEGLDNTLLILQHRLKGYAGKPAIVVRKDYGQLPLIECYAGLLNQVFMNLLSNAIDALETQAAPRAITIRTEFVRGEESSSQERTPDKIVIRIADNGPGIPLEVKSKIFDPFFTTKPIGVGTGLGLAIAHSIIVERHKGHLTYISTPGQGAEFVIELPLQQ